MSEVQRVTVAYPGGSTARFRWAGSGVGAEVFAPSEDGGSLTDHAALAGPEAARMCRAELRVEGPLGTWTARFASPVFDEPTAILWDSASQFVLAYGFIAYGLDSRSGLLRWSDRSGTPLVAVLGSTRLPHVLVQSEVETVALGTGGERRWRVAHGDVIAAAQLLGGRLVLTSYGGAVASFDASSGVALSG